MAVTEAIDKRIKEIQNDLHNINVLIQRKAELEQELAQLGSDKVEYTELVKLKPVIPIKELEPII